MLGENAGVGKSGGVIGPIDPEYPAVESFFGAGGNQLWGGDQHDRVKVDEVDDPKIFCADEELNGDRGETCDLEQSAVYDGQGAKLRRFILSTCCGFRWGQEDRCDEDGESENGQEIAAEKADRQDNESRAEKTHEGAEDGPGIFVAAEVERLGSEEGDGESGADDGLAELGGEAVGKRGFGGGCGTHGEPCPKGQVMDNTRIEGECVGGVLLGVSERTGWLVGMIGCRDWRKIPTRRIGVLGPPDPPPET